MTVSRSGQTRRPCTQISSPVFPMTVTSASGLAASTPRKNRAPPIPPASAVILMEVILSSFSERCLVECALLGPNCQNYPKQREIDKISRIFLKKAGFVGIWLDVVE